LLARWLWLWNLKVSQWVTISDTDSIHFENAKNQIEESGRGSYCFWTIHTRQEVYQEFLIDAKFHIGKQKARRVQQWEEEGKGAF